MTTGTEPAVESNTKMTNKNIHHEFLLGVEKPGRYLGTEVNAVRKRQADVSFLLAFPDTYEVGMSHLGLQILYSIINDIPYARAERCFAPWPDRERQLRGGKIPLASLESQMPLKDFDIVGFSLQYELSYTNMLNMLDLGGIPLWRDERRDGHPLVIAGGPCCFNPAPLCRFIDAFVIGDGEEVVGEIASCFRDAKNNALTRGELLLELSKLDGVYVPAVHGKDRTIRKRNVPDLNRWNHPLKPVVPLTQTIHDRISLEIARGCTRGCRFCQAGMIWRPYRERNPSLLMEMADRMLQATGYDEISLLSLSSGDYSCLGTLVMSLMNKYHRQKVALALPSLRVESLNTPLMEEIKRTRKTSFTLAPEAGTDRMRAMINKGNTSDDLLATVDKIFAAGWQSVKLYFMIGLPGETWEDLEGIVELAHEARRVASRRGLITVSLSTFVPKPHTPFQWERQISLAEIDERQEFIRRKIRSRCLGVKWHDARMSWLEGIFSRGDESLGGFLEYAFRRGCRFDGWSDLLRFDLWEDAASQTQINPEDFLRERRTDETLPWDYIDCGISREFLLRERSHARLGRTTADCRSEGCQHCGACDFHKIQNILASRGETSPPASNNRPAPAPLWKKYRLTFSKTGEARFLSHLEIAAAITRALRRSSLELAFSEGFHPHPKISFGNATPVGMESLQEFMDVSALAYWSDLNELKMQINAALPQGLCLTDLRLLASGEKPIAEALKGFEYEIFLPESTDSAKLSEIEESVKEFLAASSFEIPKMIKGKTLGKDIRAFVQSIVVDRENKKILFRTLHSQTGTARPADLLAHILKFDAPEAQSTLVVRTRSILS